MTSSLLAPAGSLGFPNMGATPPIMAPGAAPTGVMPMNTGVVPPNAQPGHPAPGHPGMDALQAQHDRLHAGFEKVFGGPGGAMGRFGVNRHGAPLQSPAALHIMAAGQGLLDRIQARRSERGLLGRMQGQPAPAPAPVAAPASIMAPTGIVQNKPANVVY